MILLKVVFIEKYPYTKLVVNFNNKQRHLKNVFQCSHCTTKKMEHELDDSESGLAQILSLSLFFFFFINLFAHKKLRSCQWRNSMKQYMNYKVFLRSGSRLNFEVLIFGEEMWKPEWLNSWLVLSNICMVSAEPLSRTGERRVLLLLRQPCSRKPQGSLGGLTGLGRDVVAMPGLG